MGEVNHQELAAETLRVLAERGWSRKQAEIRTGVGSAIISNMALGFRPRAEALVTWADAIGEDPAHWLRLGGYPQIADKVDVLKAEPTISEMFDRLQTQKSESLRTQRDLEVMHRQVDEVLKLFDSAIEQVKQIKRTLSGEGQSNAHC